MRNESVGVKMKAVISVVGNDRVGILAMVANACAQYQINVLEVSQTILDGIFSMTMIVDMDRMSVTFDEFASLMETIGAENALIIRVMNQQIFDAMHSI
jgi:ACT domain-containing protein